MAASGLFPAQGVLACPAAPKHGVRQVSALWARPGSGFTLLFEALVLSFAAAMPIAKVAAMTREYDTRIWRVVEHHMRAARDQLDCSGVRRVGVDETSAQGSDYISIVADLDARRVVFATEGRNWIPHTALTVPSGWSSPRWVSASPIDCRYQLIVSFIKAAPTVRHIARPDAVR